MKKVGFIIFLFALAIGLSFAGSSSFGSFKIFSGVKGSGISQSEIRNVSDFKSIDASGIVNVEVSSQKDFSVEVQADDNLLQYIKTEVSGDTLKIYSEGRISPKTRITVKISMPEIDGVEVSGVSNTVVSDVKGDSLKLEASGASKIKISGEAKSLESNASGASGIDAENLKVEDAEIEASGASNTTVSASNNVEAHASGASHIYYTGEPKDVSSSKSGASSIKKK
jgi:hypothetical protein